MKQTKKTPPAKKGTATKSPATRRPAAREQRPEPATQVKKVVAVITPTAESMGYEIVRVLLIGSGRPTLQVMAERPDGTMSVDDCSRLSQAISAVLDVENTVKGAYVLEVSSPGLDRPLTRLKDFERYAGFEARIEIEPALENRKRFKGKVIGVENDATVNFQDEDGNVYALPFADIQKAKLLLTDDLLKAAQRKKG